MIYWIILAIIIFLTSHFKIEGKRLLYYGLLFVAFGGALDILNIWQILEPLLSLGLIILVVGIVRTWGDGLKE